MTMFTEQIEAVLRECPPVGLACETTLRVAAATVSNTVADTVLATRVVGALRRDDAAAFEELVARLADEYDLDVRVRFNLGGFAVRFSRAM